MKRHASILSTLLLGLSTVTGLLCAAPTAAAQIAARADIPFAFSVNRQQFPAGTYTIQTQSDRFLTIYNVKTRATKVLMIRPESAPELETRSRLVFHREPGLTYLQQFWVAGSSMHIETLSHPKLNRVLAARLSMPDTTFELALK